MPYQIILGYTTEGTTDVRFLESIIKRTFENILFDCTTDVILYDDLINVKREIGVSYVEQIHSTSKKAIEFYGVTLLCLHVDADSASNTDVINNKITPIRQRISEDTNTILCRNIVPLIPIQMTESWMLADKELLKSEIGTDKSDVELGLARRPEQYADPKAAIENAIRKSNADKAKRRRRDLTISDLYSSIGQKIELSKLNRLDSYQHFTSEIRSCLINMKLLSQ